MRTDSFNKPASPTIRISVWILITLFASAIIGSYVAKVEIVVRGEGRVIPTKRVQIIQPLADGKITAIFGTEGQLVARGQLLISMDTTAAESEIKRIESEIDRQTQQRAVALSIIEPLSDGDPRDENFIEEGRTALRRHGGNGDERVVSFDALVIAILSALRDQVGQIDGQKTRIEKAEYAQLGRLEKSRAERDIIAEGFVSADSLRKGGTISQNEYLERLRVLRAAQADAIVAERELSELRAEAVATDQQRASTISELRSTYQKQLSTADITLGSLSADLRAARERFENLSLRAPEDGRVENLSVFTVGGFVGAGTTLMSIVPTGNDIALEAFFDNRDIGFLERGQRAFIKLDAFPAERFGLVRGNVTNVGADAREQGGSKKWVYAVRLIFDQTSITIAKRKIDFVPGMTAIVDVATGERRLISYFFEPIVKIIHDSFGEQ